MKARKFAKELRRASRYEHDSMLEIVSGVDGDRIEVARLVDVSSGGASFRTTLTFAKGVHIRGRLRLLGAGVLEFIGKIIRVKALTNTVLYAVEFESVRGARSGGA